MKINLPSSPLARMKAQAGLFSAVFGLALFVLGAAPEWIGLDRSSVVGFVQIAVFLVGLGFITLGGFSSLDTLRKGAPRSIAADIGIRLISTGYVFAVFTGMADVFGFGSEHIPVAVPYFGILQTVGVLTGQILIGVGFILMIPFEQKK